MAQFSKAEESYIEHEVKIRIHDQKFIILEKSLDHLNSKINWLIGIVLSAVLIPVSLHYLHLL